MTGSTFAGAARWADAKHGRSIIANGIRMNRVISAKRPGYLQGPRAYLHFLVNRVSCVNTHCQRSPCFTKISVARSQEAKCCPLNFPLVVVNPVTTAVFP